MSITIPSAYSEVPTFTLGREIRASSWKGLLRNNNLHFATAGSLVGSIVYDPYFETSSTTFVDGATKPLISQFAPMYVKHRKTGSSSNVSKLWFVFYGSGVEIQMTLNRIGGSASAVNSGTPNFPPEWVAKEIISTTNTDPVEITFQARYDNTGDATFARVYQMALYETRDLDAADLP